MSDSAETPSSLDNGTVTFPIENNAPPDGRNLSPPSPPLSDFPSESRDPNNGTAIAPSNVVTPAPPAVSPPPISNSPPPSSPLPLSPPPSSSTPSPPLTSNSPPPKLEPPSSSPTPPKFSPPPTSSKSPPPSPPPSSRSPPPSTNETLASPPPPAEGFVSPPPLDSQQSPPPPTEQDHTPPSPVVSNVPPNSSVLSPVPSTETTPIQSTSPSPPVSAGKPSDSSSTSGTKTTTGSGGSTSGTGTGTGTGTSDSGSGTTTTTRAVAGTVVAGVLLITIITLFFVVRRRKKRRDIYGGNYMPPPTNFTVKTAVGYYYGQQPQIEGFSGQANYSHGSQPSNRADSFGGPDSGVLGGNKSFFSYDEVMEITNGFSRQNIIGEGGFGCVFKGLTSDGKEVAVKQLKAGSGQGDREFKAEVEIISRVHHRHLVSLVGYSISENQRLLIYEFVPNSTLEHHLHKKGLPVLEWSKRLKIAIGSAKGLAYLHEDCHPKIIHRDIKSANILLDDDFEAQVADFGLARLNDTTQTHVSTRVMGTFGYLAPEYASSGKLTDRSDVYSFGVVLLELITGRKPVDPTQPIGDESLVEWARPVLIQAIESGDLSAIVDPRLEKRYVETEMLRMVEIAAACVRHSAPKRPRMVQVVRALDSDGEMSDLSNGVKYGQSSVYNSGQYNQDIMKFRKMALGSCTSSEFSADSSEYTSRNVSQGPLTSGDYPSGESETRAMNRPYSERKYGGNQHNYGGFM